MPAAIDIHSVPQSWSGKAAGRQSEDFAGIYPWDWVRDDVKGVPGFYLVIAKMRYWSRRSSRR